MTKQTDLGRNRSPPGSNLHPVAQPPPRRGSVTQPTLGVPDKSSPTRRISHNALSPPTTQSPNRRHSAQNSPKPAATPQLPQADQPLPPLPADPSQPFLLHRQLEESAVMYRWVVPVHQLTRDHFHSPEFTLGKATWDLLVFERETQTGWFLSFYLAVVNKPVDPGQPQPEFIPRDVNFQLKAINTDPTRDEARRCEHAFTPRDVDWGFNEFMKLDILRAHENGFIHSNDQWGSCFVFEITLKDNSSENQLSSTAALDSRKSTGFVGLKNQGATCYLNSLIQTLFHLSRLRHCVYQIPTELPSSTSSVASSSRPAGSKKGDGDVLPIPLALQRLFYHLQYSKDPVKTEELTKSFGWTQMDSFTQHDIQELNRVLCDNLENKMKSTPVEGMIQNLFMFKVRNVIRCINVTYESSREEEYYDIALCVSGCPDIYEAFKKELQKELLDGDNKYATPDNGLQDAEKLFQIQNLPPILNIHLKRFEYDVEKGALKKVIDEFKFYDEINVGQFVTKEGGRRHRPASDRNPLEGADPEDIWKLHSVLVHCGTVHGGHYYAFCRPENGDSWFKFDDDKVTRATPEQAITENFGGKDKDKFWLNTHTIPSAYMLVYVKKSKWGELVYPFQDYNVPDAIKQMCEREVQEMERLKKEKQDEHLYYQFRIATEQHFQRYDEKQLHNDLYDFDLIEDIFRFSKKESWANFMKAVSEKYGIPQDRIRLWKWSRRNNHTYRPDTLILPRKPQTTEASTLKEVLLMSVGAQTKVDRFDLFLQTSCPRVADSVPFEFPPPSEDQIFLLLKYYDPRTMKLSYVGHFTTKPISRCAVLLPFCNNLIDRPPETQLLLFEEVKPTMTERIDLNRTFKDQELQHGDIIVFQLPPPEGQAYACPYAPDVFKYLERRVTVKFAHKDRPNDVVCTVELMKDLDLTGVCNRLAEELAQGGSSGMKVQPTHLRLYSPVQRVPYQSNVKNLKEMMAIAGNVTGPVFEIVLFEELPMPLAEYETKKQYQFFIYNQKVQEVDSFTVVVDRTAVVKDCVRQLRPKFRALNLPVEMTLMDVDSGEIRRIFQPTDSISLFHTTSYLRAEPALELPLEPHIRYVQIQVVHFDSKAAGSYGYHGNPFLLCVRETDTVKSLREEIRNRTAMRKTEEFKLVIIMNNQHHPLVDEEALVLAYARTIEEKFSFAPGWKLGMDHRDNRKRSDKSQSAVVIYN